MKARELLLGCAAGVVTGYSAYRAVESFQKAPPAAPDARAYGALRRRLAAASIPRSIASAAIGAFGPIAVRVARMPGGAPQWVKPPLNAVLLAVADAFLDLPIEYVEGHRVERRYGLSDQPSRAWVADYAKEQAIAVAMAAVLGLLFGEVMRRFPKRWPALATAGMLPLLVAGNVVVPLYVLPLFNTYKPIEGELEARLRALAARFGVGDAQILSVDMSRQTKKANAFVIGIGRTHRIVVGDTLIASFTHDEIAFVVAHELGHYVAKDSWRTIAVAQAFAGTVFFAAAGLGANTVPQVQFWVMVLSQLARPALAAFSRSREWAADRFAVAATGSPADGVAAFRRLRDQNLAEDEQPGWFELLFSTHPSLRARIAALTAS